MTQKDDIQNRDDLTKLLDLFYDRLLKDQTINYLFTEVAKVDMKLHLPVIIDFWETILFQTGSYRKNAIAPHLALNSKFPLTSAHFNTWLDTFKFAVDELFEGDNAFMIKERATSIATIMQLKIKSGV